MSHRFVRIAAQSVLLGVMTSVIIAWICAARADELFAEEVELTPGRVLTVPAGDEIRRTFGHRRRVRYLGSGETIETIEAADRAAAVGAFKFYETRDEWGWPLRSMQTRSYQRTPEGDRSDPDPSWWTDGLVTSGDLHIESGTYPGRVLPVRPRWPGLLGDTVIFASAWMATFLLIGWVIAGKRVGHCPGCGHRLPERRSTGCPECGWVQASLNASRG